MESERQPSDRDDTREVVEYIDRVSLDALLWILGGFSNDCGTPRLERWTAEEDARLIAEYRSNSLNGRLANGAMMELKLKFRDRSKAALYRRIYELRKALRLEPPPDYSDRSFATGIRPTDHTAARLTEGLPQPIQWSKGS